MLCTPDTTYLLRTVDISNSLLICREKESRSDLPTLEIRDISHHVLEPVSQAPNLERLRTILKPSAWQGLGVSPGGTMFDGEEGEGRPLKRARAGSAEVKRYTREQLESVIQASTAELDKGLKERNIVEVDGKLPLSQSWPGLPPGPLGEHVS